MVKPTTWLGLAAGGAAVAWAFVTLRRRAQESFAQAAGRELGMGAVQAVVGAVGGIADATQGFAEAAVGVTPFTIEPIAGRKLSDVQTNLSGLQGRISEPQGEDSGFYVLEVQNTSSVSRSVRIELVVDKWGLDPVWELVGVVDIPAGSGVRATGTILVRSVSGILPVVARLLANKYLLAKTL